MIYKSFEKKRYNLSQKYMKVDNSQRNGNLLKSGEGDLEKYQRWMLNTTDIEISKPSKDSNKLRKIIKKILYYD
jgi:hypothetical protein